MSTPTTGKLRFEWIRDRAGFLGARDAYNELAEGALQTVFLTHAWLAAWIAELAPDCEPRVLAAWDGERLVGVLPLCAQAPGSRRWSFMGAGTLTPNHLDIVVRPELADEVRVAFSAMLLAAVAEWDELDLDKLPAESPTLEAMRTAFAEAGLKTHTATTALCYYCELPSTWDEYLASRTTRLRHKLRRAERRLVDNDPPIRVELASTPEQIAEALAAHVRFHQARWESRGYPGAFAEPAVVRFHERATKSELAEHNLRMFVFHVGERLAGVSYDFRVGDEVQAYLTSYDAEFSSLSPGTLMRGVVIKDAIAEGARYFDFLEGGETYKTDWCSDAREDVRLRVFSRTLAGTAARTRLLAGEVVVEAARKWVPADLRERAVKMLANRRVSRQE